MPLKTGRLPAVHTRRTMRLALAMAQALDALGPAPPRCRDYLAAVKAAGGFQMFGNDEYGDCVWADTANGVLLHTANAAAATVVLQRSDVLGAYSAVTGFSEGPPVVNDYGTEEVTAMRFLRETGIAGHKIDDWATLDATNLDHVRWSIDIFGGVRLGILVDVNMIQMFEARQPWVAPSPNGEGHDVRLVDYDENWFYAATWGGIQQIAPPLMRDVRFCDEAHTELWYDWIREQGSAPSDLDLDHLRQYLRYIDTSSH